MFGSHAESADSQSHQLPVLFPCLQIRLLADMKCEFTKAINMDLDYTPFLGNVRSKR